MKNDTVTGSRASALIFRWLPETAVIAVLYIGTAWLGFTLAIAPGNVTPVWLPSGIALCAVICLGYRAGVGIWIGSYVVNALFFRGIVAEGNSFPFVSAMIIATGSVLQAYLARYLINRFIGEGSPIERPLQVIRYVIISAFSCCVASSVGAGTLKAYGFLEGRDFSTVWWTWWAGDLGGFVVFSPLLMAFRPSWIHPMHAARRRLAEGIFLACLEVFLIIRIFLLPESGLPFDRVYPLVFVMIWAALRFGQPGVTASVFLIAVAAVWGTSMNRGPFAEDDLNSALVSLDLFLVMTSMSGLLLSAALTGMNSALDSLRAARDELERRVEERTADLSRINRILNESQQQAHIGSWEWDVLRNRVTWTDELFRLYGRRPEANGLTFESYLEFVHPEDRALVRAKVEHSRASGVPLTFECRIVRPDGTMRIVHAEGKSVRDAAGAVTRLFGNTQDVTGRRDVEQKYQRLLESAPESIVVADAAGKITMVNSQTERLFGYTREELIGRDIEALIPERYQYRHATERTGYVAAPRVRPMGTSLELYGRRKDGAEFPVEVALSPLTTTDGTLITAVIRDITERKKAEETIRRLNRELEVRVHERTSQLRSANSELEHEIESHLQTETQLMESSERYRTLFENSPISLWEEDFSAVKEYIDLLRDVDVGDFRRYFTSHREAVDHCARLVRIRDVNKRTVEIYRAAGKEQLLAELSQVLGKESFTVFTEELVAIAEGRTSFAAEDINTTLTGVPINILLRWNVTPGNEKTYARVLVSVVDITQQKRIEEQIRLLAHAVESTSEMISITDMSDRFIFVNKAFLHEYGYSEAEILGQNPRMLLGSGSPAEIDDEIFTQTRISGWNGELLNRRKDGSEFPISLRTSQIRDHEGRTLGLIGLATNITERKRAEHALVEAEVRFQKVFDDVAPQKPDAARELHGVTVDQSVNMDDLAQKINLVAQRMRTSIVRTLSFASLASHELRTPLTVVRHQLEEGLDLHTPEKSLREIIVSVYDEVLRLNRIVETLLSVSAMQAGAIKLELHSVNLQKLLKEFYEDAVLLSREREITVVLKQGPEIDICGDADRLRQVLYNLFDNSLKHTSAHGRIWVGYDVDQQDVVLTFSDDGRGIDVADAPRIFDPFFRGAPGGEESRGIGLGLPLSKWIVEAHHGTITVHGREGGGTTFLVRLPIVPPE